MDAQNRRNAIPVDPVLQSPSSFQIVPKSETTAMESFEALMDSAAAAVLLKIHRKTLERMALRGEVPGHKVGKFWRFRASELDEWLRSQLQSSRQPCRMKTSF